MSKLKQEYVIAPGETILELLEVNSMTQLDLALKTGINKKTINEIIKGKAPITTATALKLEYVFNIPATFFLNLESNYQSSLEREKDKQAIIAEEKYLEHIPYTEMAKRNWLEQTRDPYEKVINLRKFFSVASLGFNTELKNKLAFRKSKNDNFSFEALYCFLRYGEIEANKEECSKFDIDKLKTNVDKIRMLANKPFLEQIKKIKELLKECGVVLIYERHLPNTYVNGVSYKITPDKAIIMISDRGKKDDILWFTLFHEIAHLLKHSKKEVFVDLENSEITDIELEADEYSRNILIPDNIYKNFISKNNIYTEKIIKDFAKANNIEPGIVVGRLQKDEIIKWSEFNNLIVRI